MKMEFALMTVFMSRSNAKSHSASLCPRYVLSRRGGRSRLSMGIPAVLYAELALDVPQRGAQSALGLVGVLQAAGAEVFVDIRELVREEVDFS